MKELIREDGMRSTLFDHKNIKILLIDENILVRWSLGEVFRQEGFQVDGFPSVEEVIRQGRFKPYDILIMDYSRGRENGLQILEESTLVEPSTIIILLMPDPPDQTREDFEDSGIFAFVEKPFSIERIRSLVGKALSRQVTNSKFGFGSDIRKDVDSRESGHV